jgi:ABC-type dipeptide/oligopeptide/nickel transport system permease component
MLKFIARRLLLIALLLPLLHFIGYQYALQIPPIVRPNRPAPEYPTYWEYITTALQTGDWGTIGNIPLWELLLPPFQNSVTLVLIAMSVTLFFGLLIGLLSVSPQTKRVRPAAMLFTTAGSSIPGFLLGGIIISIIIYQILYNSWSQSPIPISGYGLREHLILPLIVLAIRPALHFAKVTSGLLEHELEQVYIQVAQSKGLRWSRVYLNHALRNIIAPLSILMGQSARYIVGGLLIVEMMFLWPGIGRYFVWGVIANENVRAQFQFYGNPYVLAGVMMLLGLMLLVADFIAAVASYQADPRLREKF